MFDDYDEPRSDKLYSEVQGRTQVGLRSRFAVKCSRDVYMDIVIGESADGLYNTCRSITILMILPRPYPPLTKALPLLGNLICLFESLVAVLLSFSGSEDHFELPAGLRVFSSLFSLSKLARGYNWCTMLAI